MNFKLTILLVLVFFGLNSMAQKFHCGGEIGYSSSNIYNEEFQDNYWFNKYSNASGFNVGLKYFVGEDSSFIRIEGGVNYSIIKNDHQELKFIEIPFGVNFKYGARLKGSVSAGIFMKNMLESSSHYALPRHFDSSRNDNLHGFYYSIGCTYEVSNSLTLILDLRLKKDLVKVYSIYSTSLLTESRPSLSYKEFSDIYISQKVISLSLIYSFKR